MPSKPGTLVVSRLRNGAVHAAGRPAAPARAPQIEPTVAPLESVSQPPVTAVVIARWNSPSLRASANATSAALLSACTQWRWPYSAYSASSAASRSSDPRPRSTP